MIALQQYNELEPLQPIEIDLAVYDLQQKFKANLVWCTHVYGRAYKFKRISGDKRLILPEVYIGNVDGRYSLTAVTPDNDKAASVFFIIGNEKNNNFSSNATNFLSYNVSIVFWVNLELIDKTLSDNEDFTQTLIRQARGVLTNGILGSGYDLKVSEVIRGTEEVFKEFTVNEDERFRKMPFSCFRFETVITIKESCGNKIEFPPVNEFPPYKSKLSAFENDMDYQTGEQVEEKINQAIAELPGVDPSLFATAAQGEKADTAVQPGDLPDFNGFASAEQGSKADSAVQPLVLDGLLVTKADLVNGKVPLSQINDALIGNVHFIGLYNGVIIESDTPENGQPLPAASNLNKGWYFICNANFIKDAVDYKVGDWILSIGSQWAKVDNTDAVTSVAGKTGNVDLLPGDIAGLNAILAGKQGVISGTGIALWNGTGITWISGTNSQLITGNGTFKNVSDFATSAQGTKADTALQLSALDGYEKKIAASVVPVTVSGAIDGTTEKILVSILVKANDFAEGLFRFEAFLTAVGVGGAKQLKVRKNATNAIAGSTILAAYTSGNTSLTIGFERKKGIIRNNQLTIFSNGVTNTLTDATVTGSAASVLDFNITTDFYIIITGQVVAADTLTLAMYYLGNIKL